MAATFSIVRRAVMGNARVNIVDVTLDASYGAGGYAIAAADVGMKRSVDAVIPVMATGEGVTPRYRTDTAKLQLFKTGSTTTVTSGNGDNKELATNDSLISTSTIVRCVVYGDFATG